MNDLTILHDAWDTPDAPSAEAHAAARAALLERAAAPRPRPRRRRRLRLAAAGALAAAVAGAVLVVENVGQDRVPTASAEVLERAATAAEDQPVSTPRDDQWIYIEERFGGTDGTRIFRTWRRVDGNAIASNRVPGKKLEVIRMDLFRNGRHIPSPFMSYRDLAALPTDPDELLSWAYKRARNATGGGMNDDGDVYLDLNHIMRDGVLPPGLEAAIFRALKQVPGVTLQHSELSGRPVLSLAMDTSSWLREEMLLDPETYAYRGERSTVTRDSNAKEHVKKGHVATVERLDTAIVDRPGEGG
jgi:hypothetical protein